MIRCIFDKSTGLVVSGFRHATPDYDSQTQALVELPDFPDRRLDRWDGSTGIRSATAQEISDYDDDGKDEEATAALASAENVVLRDILWDQELRLRAAGQPSAEADILAATTKGEYTQVLKVRVKAKL